MRKNKPLKCLNSYEFILFDSDGVVLNSNNLKLQCFLDLSNLYATQQESAVRSFILENKGATRHEIIGYIASLIPEISISKDPDLYCAAVQNMLSQFKAKVFNKLMECEIAPELERLKLKSLDSKWVVVTAGDEAETQEIYTLKGINYFFDGGIFGSPRTKQENIILLESLYGSFDGFSVLLIGDSIGDAELAMENNFDFAFISRWSNCRIINNFCIKHSLLRYETIGELVLDCSSHYP